MSYMTGNIAKEKQRSYQTGIFKLISNANTGILLKCPQNRTDGENTFGILQQCIKWQRWYVCERGSALKRERERERERDEVGEELSTWETSSVMSWLWPWVKQALKKPNELVFCVVSLASTSSLSLSLSLSFSFSFSLSLSLTLTSASLVPPSLLFSVLFFCTCCRCARNIEGVRVWVNVRLCVGMFVSKRANATSFFRFPLFLCTCIWVSTYLSWQLFQKVRHSWQAFWQFASFFSFLPLLCYLLWPWDPLSSLQSTPVSN